MKISLDVREHALIELFRKSTDSTHTIEVEQMTLGDIAIFSNDNECLLLIERKTPQDLMSSIKDGRYNEQSFRLQNHTLPNHHIVYLLEGNVYNHRDANTLLRTYEKVVIEDQDTADSFDVNQSIHRR